MQPGGLLQRLESVVATCGVLPGSVWPCVVCYLAACGGLWRVIWWVSRGIWRISRGIWRISRGIWRISRVIWRTSRVIWRTSRGIWRLVVCYLVGIVKERRYYCSFIVSGGALAAR